MRVHLITANTCSSLRRKEASGLAGRPRATAEAAQVSFIHNEPSHVLRLTYYIQEALPLAEGQGVLQALRYVSAAALPAA